MRHGAHIALIPNQLSPVHRDMQIYMSLQLGGLSTQKGSTQRLLPSAKIEVVWVWLRS